MGLEFALVRRADGVSFTDAGKKAGNVFLPDTAMPKKYRLSRKEIELLKKSPQNRRHGRMFMLSWGKISAPYSKVVCVVSSKVIPSAVARNRVRRLCKEAIRTRVALPVSPTGIMLRARAGAGRASLNDIAEDVATLLSGVA